MREDSDFRTLLARLWNINPRRLLCVGLDPDPQKLPFPLVKLPIAKKVERFCVGVVEATAPFVCAFKLQFAHFAALGLEKTLEKIIKYIHNYYPEIPVILDAKRGDIGSTAVFYAREAFARYEADAVTLNPFLGTDSLIPYWENYPNRGIFLICRTSNPGGKDLQEGFADRGEFLFEAIARRANGEWNPYGQTGLVVGATEPEKIRRVRELAPQTPLLIPGIGAQGGDLKKVLSAGLLSGNWPALIISISRAIIYASPGEEWERAIAATAQHYASLF